MIKHGIILFLLTALMVKGRSQRDFTLDLLQTSSYPFQQVRVYPINTDGEYISISQSKETPSARPFNRLDIIRYDSCGVAEYGEVVMDNLFGLISYQIHGIKQDSLVLYGRAQTVNDHPFSDGFIARISLSDLGTRYSTYRFEEGAFMRDIEYLSDSTIAAIIIHNRADKPLRYHMAILNDYKIDKLVNMNYGEFTISGSIIGLADGGFIANSERHIWRVNRNLDFVWFKEINPRTIVRMLPIDTDHIAVFSHTTRRPYRGQLVKMNIRGELLGYSLNIFDNINDALITHFKSDGDGNFIQANINWARDTVNSEMIFTQINADLDIMNQASWNIDPLTSNAYLNDIRMENGRIFWCAAKQNNQGFVTGTLSLASAACPPRKMIVQKEIDPLYTLVDDTPPNVQNTSMTVKHTSYSAVTRSISSSFICEDPFIIPDFLPSDTVYCMERPWVVDLSSIPYDAVRWTDGYPDRTRVIDRSGLYSYELTLCDSIYTEEVLVQTEECVCQPYVANAFTPNNDGLNDEWQFLGNCTKIGDFTIRVFNRWGSLVYASSDPAFSWDGSANDVPVPQGVYVYLIQYEDRAYPEPESRSLTGDLTIIR